MGQQDFDIVIQTIDRLTTGEKLVLIERLARSLQELTAEDQVSPVQQREALQRLRRKISTLPVHTGRLTG